MVMPKNHTSFWHWNETYARPTLRKDNLRNFLNKLLKNTRVALTAGMVHKRTMSYVIQLTAFVQIILIDVCMSGDNAIAVGLAAAGLPQSQRHRAIMVGIVGATFLRIVFAFFVTQFLDITGLPIVGGLLLLWIAWKMFHDLRLHAQKVGHPHASLEGSEATPYKKFRSAVAQIIIADVSMSLDNVLAIAGVARDEIAIMTVGIIFSVVLMGAASALIAKWTTRHIWIGYAGIAVILYTAGAMILDGWQDLVEVGIL